MQRQCSEIGSQNPVPTLIINSVLKIKKILEGGTIAKDVGLIHNLI